MHDALKTADVNECQSNLDLVQLFSAVHMADDKHHDHAASLYTCFLHLLRCIVLFAIVGARFVACLCLCRWYFVSGDNFQQAHHYPEQADSAISSKYYCCFFWTDD